MGKKGALGYLGGIAGGAAVGGPVGAVVGGILGALAGLSMDKKDRKKNIQKPIDNKRRNFRLDELAYVFRKHDNKCSECGAIEDLTIDHITPLSRDGTNDLDNLRPLCRVCNSRKGKR